MPDAETLALQKAMLGVLEQEHSQFKGVAPPASEAYLEELCKTLAEVPTAMQALFQKVEEMEEARVVTGYHPVHKEPLDAE